MTEARHLASDLGRLTGSERYRVLEPIGQGGMGLVYRAHDSVRRRDIALKTLRQHTPEEMYLLKKEFRALSQLAHPNLVQLYDLVVVDDQCFFTMEFVDGVDLVRYVRSDHEPLGGGAANYERLREAAYQLAGGLQALHAFGKVHRDVKPANILVESSGRVVLLDFGLASAVASDVSRHSRAGSLAGTLAYMAPEQVVGGEISPAADWYSTGLVLYEALTGTPPFEGPAMVAALARARRRPRAPRLLVPGVPEDLNALTMDLLQPVPAARPSGAEVLARLQPSRRVPADASPAPDATGRGTRFVGRSHELAELHDAFAAMRRGALVTVCVCGASGIGKTALVERFLATLPASPEPLVLRARCHPQESIPFKAVDGAVDDLARFLSHQSAAKVDALMGRDRAALLRIFPVLGRVPGIVAATAADMAGREPQEIRRRAFASLRELVARVGDRHPLVLWIDDFQWGDLDSVALLQALQTPPDAPPLLLVLSFRNDERTLPMSAFFGGGDLGGEQPAPPRQIELAPLSEADACELARQISAGEGTAACDDELVAIAREAGGSPFFTCELARHVAALRAAQPTAHGRIAIQVSGLVAQRIADLPAIDRRLLEVVSVAGAPVPEALLYRVVGGGDDIARGLGRLAAAHLVRPAVVDEQPALDTFHDRVRETVVALVSGDTCRALHSELAAALRALPNPDPHRLVEHYFRANDLAAAGEQAFISAERAMEALAFNQAWSLYRRALELGAAACPRWLLQAKLGTALANMGRAGDAAPLFIAAAAELAATDADHPEVSRLRRQAAEYYMRSGLYDEGLAVLRQVLARAGLPYIASPYRVIASLIFNRTRLRVAHLLSRSASAAGRSSARAAERLEVCWSAGLGLGVSDTLRAADFQVRHALLARRAGDAGHRARALATEALLMIWEGGERKRRRAARLRVESERLARAAGDPNIEAYSLVLHAIGTFFERRLVDAVALADRAEAHCRDACIGVAWELANVQTIGVTARVFLGDVRDLRRRVERMLREGYERGDQYALLMCRLGYCNLAWLAADDVDEASRHAQAALAERFPATFTWPIYQGVLAHTHIDLYRGDGGAGWVRTGTAWAALGAGGMLRLQPVRIEMRDLRARCALSLASQPRTEAAQRRHLLRVARHAARRIAGEDVHWAGAFADALRGAAAAVGGDRRAAQDLLEAAAVGFDHLNMGLHAAAVRLHRATLLSGPDAARLTAAQEAWMRDHGVQNPRRMAAVLSPGIAGT